MSQKLFTSFNIEFNVPCRQSSFEKEESGVDSLHVVIKLKSDPTLSPSDWRVFVVQHQKYLSPARLSGAELCQNWLAGIGKESRVTSKLHLRHRCDVEFREANGEILRSQYCVELKHFVIPFCLD